MVWKIGLDEISDGLEAIRIRVDRSCVMHGYKDRFGRKILLGLYMVAS